MECEFCKTKVSLNYLPKHQKTKKCEKLRIKILQESENLEKIRLKEARKLEVEEILKAKGLQPGKQIKISTKKVINFFDLLPSEICDKIISNVEEPEKLLHVNKDIKKSVISNCREKLGLDITDIDVCRYLTSTNRVCQTTLTTKFKLPKKMIDSLSYESVPNPRYRNGYDMKLFKLKDAIPKIVEKYHSIDEMFETVKNKKEKIAVNKVGRTVSRRKKLLDELQKYNIPFREDSRLCDRYLTDCKLKLHDVVHRMREVHSFFNDFNGASLLRQLNVERSIDKRELQNDWDDKYAHEYYHDKWDGDMIEIAEMKYGIIYNLS